ncbi:hypothetical protein JW916_10720 [Candidatus Sumerlaeota bacterium]|nr:hypothetical protein [Candidatus Sumerlaeota bacterium]
MNAKRCGTWIGCLAVVAVLFGVPAYGQTQETPEAPQALAKAIEAAKTEAVEAAKTEAVDAAANVADVAPTAVAPELKPQETCPIMGSKIDKKLYVDANGYRIYVCCAACKAKVKEDPQKAIEKLKALGEAPEPRPVVCPKCGEISGTAKCCQPDAEKCPACGLDKDSPGCCRHLKPVEGEKDVVLCLKCGEVKGSDKCCAAAGPDVEKCPKCGLHKGSPGCCTLNKLYQHSGADDAPVPAEKLIRERYSE